MKPIDSIYELDSNSFNRRYFQQRKPVVCKAAIANSAFYKNWSFAYLKERVGDRQVVVAFSKQGYYKFHDRDFFELKEMPFSKAVEYFEGVVGKNYYLQQAPMNELFPDLVNEVTHPSLILESDKVLHQNLWIGGRGCVSPLHNDSLPNLLVQVRGRKRLVMFSPEDSKYLYPEVENGALHMSRVNMRELDYDKFPLFREASPYECFLEEGDILYIPTGWWHEVYTLEPAISINYWFLRFDIDKEMDVVTSEERNNYLKHLIDIGVDVTGKDPEGEPFVIKCIREGYNNTLEALLLVGADPNTKCINAENEMTAISYATKMQNKSAVDLLVRYGAG